MADPNYNELIKGFMDVKADTPSMEGAVNENEVEFYIQNPNLNQITSMSVSKEAQEQWGIFVPKSAKNAAEGSVRVRETIKDGEEPTYELTGKQFMPDGTKDEYNQEATHDLFKFFRLISSEGMKKDRYHIPTEFGEYKLTLEVDVPYTKEGVSDWVKVDLEFPDGFGAIPSRDELAELIKFSYEGDMVIVLPSDKAAKNEAALKGIGIARKILVIGNVMI